MEYILFVEFLPYQILSKEHHLFHVLHFRLHYADEEAI